MYSFYQCSNVIFDLTELSILYLTFLFLVVIRSAFAIFITETSGMLKKNYPTEGYLQCHLQWAMEKRVLPFGIGTGKSHKQNGQHTMGRYFYYYLH